MAHHRAVELERARHFRLAAEQFDESRRAIHFDLGVNPSMSKWI
jgi:hypothetical protein